MNFSRVPWVGAERSGRPWRIRVYESWYDGKGERKRRVGYIDVTVRIPLPRRDRKARPKGMSGRQWVKLRKARRRAGNPS